MRQSKEQISQYKRKYYVENIEKYKEYNKNRPSRAKYIWEIEIDGTIFRFTKKSDIKIRKVLK